MSKSAGYLIGGFKEYLEERKYSPSCVSAYSRNLFVFMEYLSSHHISIDNFSATDIEKYLEGLNLKPQTINSKIFSIKKYCEYLKYISGVSIEFKSSISKVTKRKMTSVDGITNILDVIKSGRQNILLSRRDSMIFKFLYYIGIRVNDLVRVRKKDISESLLSIGNQRIIMNQSLSSDLKEYFQELKFDDDDYLFFSCVSRKINFKKGLTIKSIEDIFNKYTASLPNKISINDLRKSYAANILTKNLKQVDKIYLHSSVEYQEDYLRLISEK